MSQIAEYRGANEIQAYFQGYTSHYHVCRYFHNQSENHFNYEDNAGAVLTQDMLISTLPCDTKTGQGAVWSSPP